MGGPPLLLLLAFEPSASDEGRIMCVRSSPGRTTVRGASAPLLGGAAAAAAMVLIGFGNANGAKEKMSGGPSVVRIHASGSLEFAK